MQETMSKNNEKGRPFQRLEERVFARYISDVICGQAELSQITKEVLPELAGEAKLIRLALTKIASALEKINTTSPSPKNAGDAVINLAVTDDIKIVLAVRDALFQASLSLEDRIPAPQLIVPNGLKSEELEDLLLKHSENGSTTSAFDLIFNQSATNKNVTSSNDCSEFPGDDNVVADMSVEAARTQYIKDNYPPKTHARVASLFAMCEKKQEELGKPITRYTEVKHNLPRLLYYIYGNYRIWHGFSEFKAAFDAWASVAK